MATPRKDVFDPHVVGIYHCMTRCVRQLFLIGRDKKAKIENAGRWKYCEFRLEYLAGIFAIDVLDFAILSNHIHTSLRNRPDVVKEWSDQEVARRWLKLHPTEAKKKKKEKLNQKEITEQDIADAVANAKLMTKARRKLSCISHFQKTLLEPIAKEFNRRDGKKGHFVAERFRCKRIDDDGALLACSIYIALNPFRAGLGDTLEAHPHSSYSRRHHGKADWLAPLFLDERACAYGQVAMITVGQDGVKRLHSPANVLPAPRCSEKGMVPLRWSDYQSIAQWTARYIRYRRVLSQAEKNAVVVPEPIAKLLESLGIDPKFWLDTIDRYAELFHHFVASPNQLDAIARRLNRKYVKGVRACRSLFLPTEATTTDLSG
ncbi:MAG: hypothetical protein O3C60_00565 [Planctomycetota bacterium]|nr:hypothetical protein [Planctomycetota bacterium]